MITNASREGARFGIVYDSTGVSNHPSDDAIKGVITNYLQNHLISLGASSTYNPPVISRTDLDGNGPDSGDILNVTVNYQYHFLVLPEFVTTLTGPITLTATTKMRLE